ncbi:hypothetical protein [Maridesulfovibrio sp.]|uniref:hypothetical protein n=1 Tax=Maridesulfovibrio sp. TaxID=2795000 RepID=UPI0029CAA8D2|nr:hypothetical protein [Maridesulfovibrio sp.]
MPLLAYAAGWIPMIPIAIANGVLREKTYGKRMNELRAHQLSSVTAIILFYGYTCLFQKIVPAADGSEALLAGAIWLSLTVCFEFVFGKYLAGHSWKKLLADYNIFKGRLWPLVLFTIFIAPYATRT